MKKVAISLFQAMFETNFVVTVLFCHYMQMKKMLLFATTLLHSNLSEKNPVNSCTETRGVALTKCAQFKFSEIIWNDFLISAYLRYS